MFKKFTNGCVNLVQRFLPDPFIFCIILTVVVFIADLFVHGSFMQVLTFWGDGVWGLLSFAMQMALVLVLGTAMANAPIIQKGLKKLASIPKTPFQSIIFVTLISTLACWLNWGFGLVVGAIFAKEIAKQVKGVDYRLLIASAYSGFVVWHAGLSGSIPLKLASWSESLPKETGNIIASAENVVSLNRTVFSVWNILICLVILILMPIVNAKMHPTKDKVVAIDPKLLIEAKIVKPENKTPAQKLENSRIMAFIVVILGAIYIVKKLIDGGIGGLDLNLVNLIFLVLGVLCHKTPIAYVNAITDAVKGAGGVLLQFPFYAGIMGMMTGANPETGASLAGIISNGFVAISNKVTFPLWTFLSAGVVNFFVPSGGGQWTVQGPIMMPAGQALGVDPALTAMGIAWGDAWTNMLQPFWALPALGIAGLGARDIMGYCIIDLLLTGVIVVVGFLIVGLVL